MIARVRFAPVERWCKEQINHAIEQGFEPSKYVGQEVLIITETMKVGAGRVCPARSWQVPSSDASRLRQLDGKSATNHNRWICEHVLEMD